MKKITFLLILLTLSLGYSQQQTYVLDFETGTTSGNTGTWNSFEGANPETIIDNPDLDGTNSTLSKVLRITAPSTANQFAGFDNSFAASAFGTWKIDAAVSSNMTITIDVNKNYIGTIGVKMVTNTGATPFQITDQNVANAVVNEWQTLTYTIPAIPPTLETNISAIVIFLDPSAPRDGSVPSELVLHVDNITWNAEKLTDPVAPTCSDGVQNGDETGIDCGGMTCSACITDPTVNAPTPGTPESEVLSVYSDAYTTNTVTNFNFQDFTGGGPNAEVEIEGVGNGKTGNLQNLSFYGPAFDAINLTSYNWVHLDYYATTSSSIKFFVIDGDLGACCGDAREPRYTIEPSGGDEVLVQGSWQSVNIPLSFFINNPSLAGLTWDGNPVTQLKFEGNGNLFFDNIYFSVNEGTTLGTDDFSKTSFRTYPNPTQDSWTIETQNVRIASITVYDVLGKSVMAIQPNEDKAVIDGSSLKSGLYFAKVETAEGVSSVKLIKK